MDMMIKAVIYMLIIQQIDGNIFYPRKLRRVMKVHLITIMVLSYYQVISTHIGMVAAIPVLFGLEKETVKFFGESLR